MTDTHSTTPSGKREWVLGPLLVLISALVFLPWLGGELVWDDPLLVTGNTLTHSLGNIGLFFQVDLWETTPKPVGATGFYRPLMLLELALDRALFENSARALHLHSLLWHLGVIVLFLRLCARMGLGRMTALAGAVLVALHPVQAEAVFFVSARNDSMATAWLLGAFLWLLPADERLGTGRLLLGGICTLAAALCKESVLLAPLALVILSRWKDEGRWNLRGVGAMGVGLCIYLRLRSIAGVPWPRRAQPLEVLDGTPEILAFFSADLLYPVDIGPGLHLKWPPDVPWFALGFLLLLLFGLGRFGGRQGRWALGLLAVFLAPAIFAAATTLMPAQRYLYLPMVALGLGCGVVLQRVQPIVQRGLAALLLVTCSGLIGLNAAQWQSDVMLWSSAVERHPGGYSLGAYAKTLENLERLEEAGELYARATAEVHPPFIESCWNVAQVQIRLGRPWAALENGLAALENGCPPEEELLSPIGLSLALGGDWGGAEEILSDTDRDPWGQIIVVQLAAAAVRRDLEPLKAETGTLDAAHPLVRQVRFLLRRGGAQETLEWMNQEALKAALPGSGR